MSAEGKVDDTQSSNTNNSSQIDGCSLRELADDDASSKIEDVHIEEVKSIVEPGCSNTPQPDVYLPNMENSKTEDEEISTGDKIETDKWEVPYSNDQSGSSTEGPPSVQRCEGESRISEELCVKLPPLTSNEQEIKSSKNNEQSMSELETVKKDDSVENKIVETNSNQQLTVKLPPLSQETTETESKNGADLNDSLQDKADSVNDRSQSPMDDSSDSLEGVYQIKWVRFKGKDVPIITQNENGPCPLLAIMNVLLLKGKVQFTSDTEIISSEQMMAHLGECILANKPQNATEVVELNYEQNMHDAMAVIHKLQTGLDVNVRFNGVSEFEYTPECIIFDLLGISLYHGWLVDPQNSGEVSAIGNCSYNQLVEKIISQRSSENSDLITEALVAEAFLDRTASQLTYHGLCELSSTVKSDQLCVFFRNNHFCTLYRHKDELFLLVTDQGFLHERNIVWETLNNVEGDHYFVDSDFHTYTKPAPAEPILPPDVTVNSDEQVNHDYLLAMSLQQEQQICVEQMDIAEASHQPQRPHLSDAQLAARLQAEEDAQAAHHAAQQQPMHHGNARVPPSGSHGQQQRSRDRDRPREREKHRDRSKEKDSCCIL